MKRKVYSFLIVAGLLVALPLAMGLTGTTTFDVSSPYIDCDAPLVNSPSGVNGDKIALASEDGTGCVAVNITNKKYDIALQYRQGPTMGIATGFIFDPLAATITDLGPVEINQNNATSKLVTTQYVQFQSGASAIVTNSGQGLVNIEGFVVRPHR